MGSLKKEIPGCFSKLPQLPSPERERKLYEVFVLLKAYYKKFVPQNAKTDSELKKLSKQITGKSFDRAMASLRSKYQKDPYVLQNELEEEFKTLYAFYNQVAPGAKTEIQLRDMTLAVALEGTEKLYKLQREKYGRDALREVTPVVATQENPI